MLTLIRELIDDLNENGITYCHWKSNMALHESLLGQTDIDLLVHQQDTERFQAILKKLTFSPAETKDSQAFPTVEHYYALDKESGVLVHVHSYYQVITGESLTKNYHLPLEKMLLQNTREMDSVLVPTKSAELVPFTIRMMLKHTSPMELALLARYWNQVKEEACWLSESDSIDDTLSFVRHWLPELDPVLFEDCVRALKEPAPLKRRVQLGHKLRSQLRPYARHSTFRVWVEGVQKFTRLLVYRLIGSRKDMAPEHGGAIIAFVGSEATGKSTLIAEMRDWLGEHFSVEQIHTGKPKSTLLSLLPNMFVPTIRRLLPRQRSTRIENENAVKKHTENVQAGYPLPFVLRSTLLAYDRRSLLNQASRKASNGTIVLSDRYPSAVCGAPDSPQLSSLSNSSNRLSIRRWLALQETKWYQGVPSPDLVVYLSAPLEVTLLRNATRGKKEPEDYVRQRHARSTQLEFENTSVYEINTQKPIDQTILEVKEAVWNIFQNSGPEVRRHKSTAFAEKE